MDKAHYVALSEAELPALPWYVQEYYQAKVTIPLSPATLYQYLTEYRRFFAWLISEAIVPAPTIADVPLDALANLSKAEVELFKGQLLSRSKENAKSSSQSLSHSTVNRALTAITSLFNYLTTETENNVGEPYFYRNVMKKVALVRNNQTYSARAAAIKSKLMLGDEDHAYVTFINEHYAATLSDKAKQYFERDRLRDVAINALLLASGLRVSEAANSNISDLNLKTTTIAVVRKGGRRDVVPIADWVLPYLSAYLDQRTNIYQAQATDRALFLTRYHGRAQRMQTTSIEKMVAKYSSVFKVRVTPHKLRHSLASKLYLATKNEQLVATQLGQNTTSATGLYTHIIDEQQRQALDKM